MTDLLPRLQAALGATYRLEKELGGGGMSRVFLAEEIDLGRKVVIKLLPPELAAAVSVDRFRREIHLAARLQHPHVVPLLTAGAVDGLLYYTMPLVEGESLRARLAREGELPINEAVRILRDVADALAYAHGQGVVHRDIKPDNVLITGHHAVVTDFGVAKAVSQSTGELSLTSVGVALGTPAYMAPEQAVADSHADHRADIYAFGAMAYELLAGQPPFRGATPQQVLGAHLTEPPVPVTKLRSTVPAALAELVMRCLEKKPADRWQTAEEVHNRLEAMTTPSGGTMPVGAMQRVSSRRWPLVAALALLSAVGIGVVSWLRARPRAALDADLIAVAPFDVLGSDLEIWREGLVDVLSRNLDGAGPLRTVSPTVVIRRWSGRAEPASATDLGRRTGTRLAVFGRLVATSGDSVRLNASVLDIGKGAVLGEIEVRDAKPKMDRLADSLTLRVLREVGRSRPIGAARLASFGTASLTSMKFFLQGEQQYRRSNWDSARVNYQRATELDSSFALAYNRLGAILGWQSTLYDSLAETYQLKAGALNHGLPPRESLLIVTDSLMSSLSSSFPVGLEFWLRTRRLFRTVDEAMSRYPDDPEVSLALGEARFHFGLFGGTSLRRTREAFDRAIASDSAFAPAYIHAVELALNLEGPAEARKYIDAYLSLAPRDKHADGIRLVGRLLDPAEAHAPETEQFLRTAGANTLSSAYLTFWDYSDSAETATRLARMLAEGRPGFRPWSDSVVGRGHYVRQLLRRGKPREAVSVGLQDLNWRYVQAVMLGAVPPDSAAATFRRWLHAKDRWSASALWWWAEQGDTTAIKAFIAATDSVLQREGRPFFALASEGYLALARRDTVQALERFTALPDSLCQVCGYERLTRVRLLTAKGRDREAAAKLDAPITQFPDALGIVWALERARVNDRLRNRDRAVEAYSLVANTWRNAEPELQPAVREARAALSRLTGEPRP